MSDGPPRGFYEGEGYPDVRQETPIGPAGEPILSVGDIPARKGNGLDAGNIKTLRNMISFMK